MDIHEEWKNKQGKNPLVSFSNPVTNIGLKASSRKASF